MEKYDCPKCGEMLEPVRYNSRSFLNFEQWHSIRAGDYFCNDCTGERGKSGKRYYWKSELEEIAKKEDIDCT